MNCNYICPTSSYACYTPWFIHSYLTKHLLAFWISHPWLFALSLMYFWFPCSLLFSILKILLPIPKLTCLLVHPSTVAHFLSCCKNVVTTFVCLLCDISVLNFLMQNRKVMPHSKRSVWHMKPEQVPSTSYHVFSIASCTKSILKSKHPSFFRYCWHHSGPTLVLAQNIQMTNKHGLYSPPPRSILSNIRG